MKVADVLTNEFLVRYDEATQRLLIFTLKNGQPTSDVPIVSRLSMLEEMGKTEASRWVGETLLILIPTTREKLFDVHE
jgi:hypothetical protein